MTLIKARYAQAGLSLVQNKLGQVSKVVEEKVEDVSKAIQKQTGKVPTSLFFWAAAGAVATSAWMQFRKKRHMSLFIGEWAPTLLLLGVCQKLANEQKPVHVPVRAKRGRVS